MLRAALKSLLGRKVRLLMSTFAIVLSVAFVGGSLIFSDTLGRSFTALFASTVGDVIVRPADGADSFGASTVSIPSSVIADLEAEVPDAARVDGRIRAQGVYVVDKDNKVVGGSGPPALGGAYSEAPVGHGLTGLVLVEGHAPHGPDEVVLDTKTAQRSGYFLGEKVHIVTAADQALVTPKLVGLMAFPDGGSLNGATYAAFDTARAQDLFLGGKDAYSQIWVTAKDGVSQEQPARRGRGRAAGRPGGGDRRRGGRRGGRQPAGRDQLPADVPAHLRRRLGRGRRLPDREHVLDPGRPAQPGAGAAAGPRRVGPPGHALGAAGGAGDRADRRHARRGSGRGAGRRHPEPVRRLRARPHRPAADLRAAHGPGLLRGGRARHDGRRLAARAPDGADRARAGPAGRRRAAGDVPAAAAGVRDDRHRRRRGRDDARALRRRAPRRVRPGRRHPDRAARRDRGQPGGEPAVPGGRPGDVPTPVRHRRQPRRPELPAQPPAYDGHRVRADDRARPGLPDGDHRRVREGVGRPGGRGELQGRLPREQRLRRAVLTDHRRRPGEGAGGGPHRASALGPG